MIKKYQNIYTLYIKRQFLSPFSRMIKFVDFPGKIADFRRPQAVTQVIYILLQSRFLSLYIHKTKTYISYLILCMYV